MNLAAAVRRSATQGQTQVEASPKGDTGRRARLLWTAPSLTQVSPHRS